jgi:hypothetical protein
MGYVIAAILVLLIVGGFVLFLVTNATRKSNISDAGDPGADQNSLSIVGSDDETPAGDTSEHADHAEGTSVNGGTDADRADVARPVVGGEGEGERSSR